MNKFIIIPDQFQALSSMRKGNHTRVSFDESGFIESTESSAYQGVKSPTNFAQLVNKTPFSKKVSIKGQGSSQTSSDSQTEATKPMFLERQFTFGELSDAKNVGVLPKRAVSEKIPSRDNTNLYNPFALTKEAYDTPIVCS